MPFTSDIRQFHLKYDLAYEGQPRQLDEDLASFRISFMDEELSEYVEAYNEGDLEKQLDALVDLVYVALGTAYLQGFNFAEAWRRVHEANMKKRRATELDIKAKRARSEHDVVKPEGWEPPVLSDLVGKG